MRNRRCYCSRRHLGRRQGPAGALISVSGTDCGRVSFVYTPRRIWQKGGQPLFSGSNELFLAVLTIFLVPVRYRRLLALAFVLVGMSTGIGYLIGW